MRREKTIFSKRRTWIARALIIVIALLTLCISEGVGLQLLPIPDRTFGHEGRTLSAAATDLADPNRPSTPHKVEIGRVEIAAPKLKKSARQAKFEHGQVVALLAAGTALSDPHRHLSPRPPAALYAFDPVRRPASRAPPRYL